jgi:Transposase domain (DUF772)
VPLQSVPIPPLPADSAHAAKSVFNIENLYVAIGDQLDSLCADLRWDDVNAFGDMPAQTSFILAMVTVFQFAENVPDSQAADAVRMRMDWKYALHLPMDYPGFPSSELGAFRQGLSGNKAGQRVFQQMLAHLAKLGLLRSRDKRQADVGHVLAAVETLSRVEKVTEDFSLALEALADRDHDWLRANSLPHWYERHRRRSAALPLPGSIEEQETVLRGMGADISYLLEAIDRTDALKLVTLPEVLALRRTWQQELEVRDSRRDSNSMRR